jgi:hypothetical protein
LDAADLDRLDQGRGPVKLVIPSARAWLQAERARQDTAAMPVPSMLAVDVAAHPGELRCEAALATLTSSAAPALIVSSAPGSGGRHVTWCHGADAAAKTRMIGDVLRLQPVRQ